MSGPTSDLVDQTLQIPEEIILHIFSLLDTKTLASCSQTCRRWRSVIAQAETLWKLQCLQLKGSQKFIRKDRKKGRTWKESFIRNYGSSGAKRHWKQGSFSNPGSYKDLPDTPFCRLDTESWGQILQWELERS